MLLIRIDTYWYVFDIFDTFWYLCPKYWYATLHWYVLIRFDTRDNNELHSFWEMHDSWNQCLITNNTCLELCSRSKVLEILPKTSRLQSCHLLIQCQKIKSTSKKRPDSTSAILGFQDNIQGMWSPSKTVQVILWSIVGPEPEILKYPRTFSGSTPAIVWSRAGSSNASDNVRVRFQAGEGVDGPAARAVALKSRGEEAVSRLWLWTTHCTESVKTTYCVTFLLLAARPEKRKELHKTLLFAVHLNS